MTTITNAPAASSNELIGADRLTTPAAAKDAATVKRTTRQHKPAADKPADKKAAPKGKGASKPAAAKPSGKQALYFISANRPASGALLHAHTEAFFRIYDMHKKGGAPLSTARAVMGATAINYHVSNARFEKRDGRLYMTEAGKLQFGSRIGGIDEEAVKAFMAVMTGGKADGQYVKAQAAISKVA